MNPHNPGYPSGMAPPPGAYQPPQQAPSPYAPQTQGYPPQNPYAPQQPPQGYPSQAAPPPGHFGAPGAYQPHGPGMPPPAAPPGYGVHPGYPPQAAPPGRGMPAARGRAFDGNAIAAANMAGTRYPLFLEGEYVVCVEKNLVTARKPCFVAEFQIIQSSNPNRPPGTNAAWVQKLDDPDVAYPSIKRYAACALGCATEQQLLEIGVNLGEMLNACADPEQPASHVYPPNPLKDRWLSLIVTNILTKKNTPFTRHDWYPYVPQQHGQGSGGQGGYGG